MQNLEIATQNPGAIERWYRGFLAKDGDESV